MPDAPDPAEVARQVETALRLLDQWLPSSRGKVAIVCRLELEIVKLRQEASHRTCDDCGESYHYSAREQDYDLAHDEPPPTQCAACRCGPDDHLRECGRCHQPFVESAETVAACVAEACAVPTTCPPCRFFARH